MKSTRLSVNINKIALLRNARGENVPDLIQVAKDCIQFGAQGITVHPRPDERHITYQDVKELKKEIDVVLNVEGYPSEDFLTLVEEVKPAQVTLVPDPPEAITSNAGWDVGRHHIFLYPIIKRLQQAGCRVSLFIHPDELKRDDLISVGTDCIELYTYDYARDFVTSPEKAIEAYQKSIDKISDTTLRIHAGHDLNQENLGYLLKMLTRIEEVSIGHALISEALYDGLETTIKRYRKITTE